MFIYTENYAASHRNNQNINIYTKTHQYHENAFPNFSKLEFDADFYCLIHIVQSERSIRDIRDISNPVQLVTMYVETSLCLAPYTHSPLYSVGLAKKMGPVQMAA